MQRSLQDNSIFQIIRSYFDVFVFFFASLNWMLLARQIHPSWKQNSFYLLMYDLFVVFPYDLYSTPKIEATITLIPKLIARLTFTHR